jgi:hypothetical protein
MQDKLNSGIPIVLQIAKLIPQEIFNKVVEETKSDFYYKTIMVPKI